MRYWRKYFLLVVLRMCEKVCQWTLAQLLALNLYLIVLMSIVSSLLIGI